MNDGRQMVGQMLAFDKVRVLCPELRLDNYLLFRST